MLYRPVTYLLQFGDGHNLSTDAGHISLSAAGTMSHHQTPGQIPGPAGQNTAGSAGASVTGEHTGTDW